MMIPMMVVTPVDPTLVAVLMIVKKVCVGFSLKSS
jgi:hypothetical protein